MPLLTLRQSEHSLPLKLWVCVQAQEPPVSAHSLLFLFQEPGRQSTWSGACCTGHPFITSVGFRIILCGGSGTYTAGMFSFVMVHSASRGHWRDEADSMAPTDGSAVPFRQGYRLLKGGSGIRSPWVLFAIPAPQNSCHCTGRQLVHLLSQPGPLAATVWLPLLTGP